MGPLCAAVGGGQIGGILAESAERIEKIERRLIDLPQVDCPLKHVFSKGVYYRQIHMPAGLIVIGHQHKTKHLNIILKGSAVVMMDGVLQRVVAGDVFESGEGVRKVLYIESACDWATIHITNETDLDQLEKDLIIKSDAFMEHQLREDAEKLRLVVQSPSVDANS